MLKTHSAAPVMPGEGYTNEGLYEGGYASYKTGVWRPETISCMFDNHLGHKTPL